MLLKFKENAQKVSKSYCIGYCTIGNKAL
ncbi:MAG: zinc-finger domain-containing protein [Oscillospiraceae bacterium]|nr:zinc-finger domain-containing protein [Oscillospiraceae bacterium]